MSRGDNPPEKKSARGRRRKHTARLTSNKPTRPTGEAAKRLPRGEAVRALVRRAALECFGAFGFEGTSTRAVAAHADISHSLLLYHFKSKDELWRATMSEVIQHYLEQLAQRMDQAGGDDPAGQLRAFVEHFIRYSARVPQLHRIMTQQSTQGSERIEWLVENYLRDAFASMCDIIERGQAAGSVLPGEPGRIYYAIVGLAGTLLSVSTEFRLLTGRDVFTEPEIQRTIAFVDAFLFIAGP
ncbi:MAG: TetR/AcrR family transcriptional regulator [Salinisphaera sp.]|nr:TetR/AcrR family transcriptional regulator [Salinisphaera sp.]